MIEPEMAFADQDDNMVLQENFVSAIVQRVLERCPNELKVLERSTEMLERVKPPFPRISYDEAVERINAAAGGRHDDPTRRSASAADPLGRGFRLAA